MTRVDAIDGGHGDLYARVGMVVVVAMLGAVLAAVLGARAALAPIAFVAVIAIACAVHDARDARIPNALVAAGLVAVAAAWGPVSALDDVAMPALGRDLLVGCLLSGAPVMFAVWVFAPRLIGGGDWKLLAVCGLAVGYAAPTVAALVGALGIGVAAVAGVVGRRRHVVLGPGLALGYLAAVAVSVAAPGAVGAS